MLSHSFSRNQLYWWLSKPMLGIWVLIQDHALIFDLLLNRNTSVIYLNMKDNLIAFQAQVHSSSLHTADLVIYSLFQSVLYFHCSLFSSLNSFTLKVFPNDNRCSSLLLETAEGITKEKVLLAFILSHLKTHFQLPAQSVHLSHYNAASYCNLHHSVTYHLVPFIIKHRKFNYSLPLRTQIPVWISWIPASYLCSSLPDDTSHSIG